MIMSNKKYADPTKLLQLLSKNEQIGDIGDQKDVGEFNMAFLGLLCEGFQAVQASEESKAEEAGSPSRE